MCPEQEKLWPWKVCSSVTSLTHRCFFTTWLSVWSDRRSMPSAGMWISWYWSNFRSSLIMGASCCPYSCVLPAGVYRRTPIHFCFPRVSVQASGLGAKLESRSYANESWGQFKDRLLLWTFVLSTLLVAKKGLDMEWSFLCIVPLLSLLLHQREPSTHKEMSLESFTI